MMLTKKTAAKNEVKESKTPKSAPQGSFPLTEMLLKAPGVENEKKAKKSKLRTQVVVNYDVGFNNHLTIRGNGANLNWEKGQPLKNTKSDEWVWETESDFTNCEFKVLINDHVFEVGENRSIKCGALVRYKPKILNIIRASFVHSCPCPALSHSCPCPALSHSCPCPCPKTSEIPALCYPKIMDRVSLVFGHGHGHGHERPFVTRK